MKSVLGIFESSRLLTLLAPFLSLLYLLRSGRFCTCNLKYHCSLCQLRLWRCLCAVKQFLGELFLENSNVSTLRCLIRSFISYY